MPVVEQGKGRSGSLGDKQSFCRSYFSRSTQEIKQIILSLCNAVNDIVFMDTIVTGTEMNMSTSK
ncbi:MAG: hypothetical protein GDA43_26530 [Hormoscilla sp. SP5CHS1]|nr:hypothetical protein [Hormoscilla sp. SP12CHS1]MBC6456275.1 hypothetical protein [Hormoscilla sp. SP5CHS1]